MIRQASRALAPATRKVRLPWVAPAHTQFIKCSPLQQVAFLHEGPSDKHTQASVKHDGASNADPEDTPRSSDLAGQSALSEHSDGQPESPSDSHSKKVTAAETASSDLLSHQDSDVSSREGHPGAITRAQDKAAAQHKTCPQPGHPEGRDGSSQYSGSKPQEPESWKPRNPPLPFKIERYPDSPLSKYSPTWPTDLPPKDGRTSPELDDRGAKRPKPLTGEALDWHKLTPGETKRAKELHSLYKRASTRRLTWAIRDGELSPADLKLMTARERLLEERRMRRQLKEDPRKTGQSLEDWMFPPTQEQVEEDITPAMRTIRVIGGRVPRMQHARRVARDEVKEAAGLKGNYHADYPPTAGLGAGPNQVNDTQGRQRRPPYLGGEQREGLLKRIVTASEARYGRIDMRPQPRDDRRPDEDDFSDDDEEEQDDQSDGSRRAGKEYIDQSDGYGSVHEGDSLDRGFEEAAGQMMTLGWGDDEPRPPPPPEINRPITHWHLKAPLVDPEGGTVARGGRKSSGCIVSLKPAAVPMGGRFLINNRSIASYFQRSTHQDHAMGPLLLTGLIAHFDVHARVSGGGPTGQSGAIRHGLARALENFQPELRAALKPADMLRRDGRKVERKKFGHKKARKMKTWVKR